MGGLSKLEWGVIRFTPLILFLAVLCLPLPVNAQGGIAVSGSFYRQDFVLPQGASISGPSIDVVVFNNGSEPLSVRMLTESPLGVEVILSSNDFVIPAGGQERLLVTVHASEDAVPGEYEIEVTAESYRKEEGKGLRVLGAAGLTASLTVIGEAAHVTVLTRSADGDAVVSTIRLFKLIGEERREMAQTDSGRLEAKVSPGDFLAVAYIGDQKLAEERFSISPDEQKTISLTVNTIFFAGFGVVPYYSNASGQLGFAKATCTLRNLYRAVENAEVHLLVTRDGTPADEVTVTSMTMLNIGDMELSYSYIPAEGWMTGRYGFQFRLDLGGEPYTHSPESSLEVTGSAPLAGIPPQDSGGGTSLALVGGAVGGAAILLAGGAYCFGRKRRKAHQAVSPASDG